MSRDHSAPEQRRGVALPVRIFAVALIFVSAIGLLFVGLFHFLPMLVMTELRAEGFASDAGLIVLMLGTGLLETFVTLIAAVALLRDRGWARAWIVCASLAHLIPPILGLLLRG